jgi:hypothetical protein
LLQTQSLGFKHRNLGSLIDFREVCAGTAANRIALIDAAATDRMAIVKRKCFSGCFRDVRGNFVPHSIKSFGGRSKLVYITADTLLFIFLVNLTIKFSLREPTTHATLKYYMGGAGVKGDRTG